MMKFHLLRHPVVELTKHPLAMTFYNDLFSITDTSTLTVLEHPPQVFDINNNRIKNSSFLTFYCCLIPKQSSNTGQHTTQRKSFDTEFTSLSFGTFLVWEQMQTKHKHDIF